MRRPSTSGSSRLIVGRGWQLPSLVHALKVGPQVLPRTFDSQLHAAIRRRIHGEVSALAVLDGSRVVCFRGGGLVLNRGILGLCFVFNAICPLSLVVDPALAG